MKRIVFMTVGVCLLMASGQVVSADDFDRVDAAVAATEHHSARFTQTFRAHGSEHGLVESGFVTFGTLPEMRWTYEVPEKKIFVFDGVTSSLYVPADRQVSVHRLTREEKKGLPFLMLKDERLAREAFDISVRSEGRTDMLVLDPKSDGPIQSLIVTVDRRSGRIAAIEYEDLEQNRTRFELTDYRKATASEKTFTIEAPDDVKVVEY